MVVVMHGLVTIEPLIAQGCRALSEESVWLVQGCSGNIISAVSSPHMWHWLSLTAGRAACPGTAPGWGRWAHTTSPFE